jgi:hypothetical protein
MTRYALIAALILSVLLFLASAPPSGAASEDVQKVEVTNIPQVQRVSGLVGVDGPVRTATFSAIEEVEVPPVSRGELTRLIDGGTLSTEGFGNVVLSLSGRFKGSILQDGAVGALLIPETAAIQRAFEEKRQLQFTLEVRAATTMPAAYFASEQPRHLVAFPRYHVWFYNDTGTTVSVNLYAYLTH